ncbi:iS5 family transposase [Acinetobacter baumannii 96512]|nr:iS5 family transposase [Acinetobacter baumannii 96512]
MNKSTPKIYRTTNWSSYNRALINRGNIAIWFDPATQWYAPKKANKDEIKLTPTQLSNAA